MLLNPAAILGTYSHSSRDYAFANIFTPAGKTVPAERAKIRLRLSLEHLQNSKAFSLLL